MKYMKKHDLMPTVVLSTICIVVAFILSAINMITAPIIEEARNAAANAALLVVLPEGEKFEAIDLSTVTLPASVTRAYKETNGKGYVIEANVKGYKPGLVVMCGVDASGKITGTKCLETQDNYGLEPLLEGTYNGQTLENVSPVIAAGATPNSATSMGYYEAVKAALQSYVILSGGTVDLRDPAQILDDNCNAALGTEGLHFTKWFAVEYLAGVDALYLSEGTEGAVLKLGDVFVGIGADGSAVPADGVDASAAETAEAAYAVYLASSMEEITLPEGVSKNVLKAWKTASGNFVFEVQAAGYGINGEYVASGEYIKLKLAISADGAILATLTVSQKETEGIGDVCMDPEYYEQFNGKTSENYVDVPNISGATVTTSGYKSAVKAAFGAYDLLKGESENETE